MTKKIKLALCEGRHQMPADVVGTIFGKSIADPTDTDALLDKATRVVCSWVRPDQNEVLVLYVTGMTVAVGAVIRACLLNGIQCILMHYDREADDYYPQVIC